MNIDKAKLQPLLWAVVGAWKAGDQDLHLRTDALDAFLGETTVEEVALSLLAEIERLSKSPIQQAVDGIASAAANHLAQEAKGCLEKGLVEQIDQLKAENKALRTDNKAWRLTVEVERRGARLTADELERLKGPDFAAELAALQKDADRYRWLKDDRRPASELDAVFNTYGVPVDEAVDSAMSKEAFHD